VTAPKLKVLHQSDESVQIEPDQADPTLWIALVHAGMGSLDWPFGCKLLDELVNAELEALLRDQTLPRFAIWLASASTARAIPSSFGEMARPVDWW
jgi:hypothetical protein